MQPPAIPLEEFMSDKQPYFLAPQYIVMLHPITKTEKDGIIKKTLIYMLNGSTVIVDEDHRLVVEVLRRSMARAKEKARLKGRKQLWRRPYTVIRVASNAKRPGRFRRQL